MLNHPFEPIIDKNSKILILGSFPSIKSFEESFYYSHPTNQFWKILSKLFNAKELKTKKEKIEFLKKNKIVIWDMVKSCKRENSLDTSLKEIEVNDIARLLKDYPNIKAIFFTGRLSERLYKKNFSNLEISTFYLPSPSSANAKIPFNEKVERWEVLKNFL
jgi:hypoxanthine-DNA glycosylase